jgi:high-affinity nickel-transport protein
MWKDLFQQKSKWIGYVIVVILLHIFGIIGLWSAARAVPSFWAIGFLAYTFGLRHAFDVDHIAAIDNTVRKLVEQKKNPLGVGYYFSLGHSSVVFLMTAAVAISVKWAERELPWMEKIGGVIGATVSGSFLVIIGFINFLILLGLCQLLRKYRSGHHQEDEFEKLLEARGFFSRMIGPFYKFITKSWHVYPLGFLFGLGFDTASEVALLAISVGAVKSAIPFYGILSLPLLFAAGMSMMDTADGMLMTTAYKWAFSTPLRKLYYNLTVTTIAVLAALIIGVVELGQVLSKQIGLQGSFWTWLQELDFGQMGYLLVALFVLTWAISLGAWKLLKIEERWRAKA